MPEVNRISAAPAGADAEPVTLYYETFGDRSGRPLLLVNGLGSQLVNWEPRFCEALVDRGFHVVVFDNRDVGLSSKSQGPPPDLAKLMADLRSGRPLAETLAELPRPLPYTLADMAADGFAVLDAVDIDRAHVAGMSMGGMIVQRMAIDRPARVRSMTSIMSTTGARGVGRATPEAARSLVEPPPTDRDGYVDWTIRTRRATAGSYFDADRWGRHAAVVYDRMFHPAGEGFQMAAVLADGDRTEELGRLSIPTMVIHGRLDPLITMPAGEATAAAIPGAELVVVDGMGHDLPPEVWEVVIDAITRVADAC